MEPVRSTRNPRVTEAARLRRARTRHEAGLTLIEGPNVFGEALTHGAEIVTVFSTEATGDVPQGAEWVWVTPAVLAHLADTVTPQGPVATIRIPDPRPVGRDHLTVAIGDPGNAGTIIRTAAAFSFDVVFGHGAVDPWSPKVLRAAAGAHFRTAIGLPSEGSGRIATVPKDGIDVRDLGAYLDPARLWSVEVGAEAHGLALDVVETADVRVTIPMPGGTESLNAAVAGAIVAYELSTWRRGDGAGHPTR